MKCKYGHNNKKNEKRVKLITKIVTSVLRMQMLKVI